MGRTQQKFTSWLVSPRMCLPPTNMVMMIVGSMTGAPKKRSVEILQTLEDSPRSIYSGVFGYWCVSGAGDWSVTIRSCFKFQDTQTSSPSSPSDSFMQGDSRDEEWQVGAGGAITALSDADDEWEEMVIKLHSVLKSFGIKE